jgi:uncharacterized protein with HEPN domain
MCWIPDVSSTRHDLLYLSDMVEAADAVATFVAGVSREAFVANDLLRTAVLKKLEIMGEASRAISDEFKATHPAVPWTLIKGLRNVAVHAYFRIDWGQVWVTATRHAPETRDQIAAILASEFPEEPSAT